MREGIYFGLLFLLFYPQYPQMCLTYNRYSINVCYMSYKFFTLNPLSPNQKSLRSQLSTPVKCERLVLLDPQVIELISVGAKKKSIHHIPFVLLIICLLIYFFVWRELAFCKMGMQRLLSLLVDSFSRAWAVLREASTEILGNPNIQVKKKRCMSLILVL